MRTWHYERPDAEHLILDRPSMRAMLTLEPPPPLTTRGFHWVNRVPLQPLIRSDLIWSQPFWAWQWDIAAGYHSDILARPSLARFPRSGVDFRS